MRKKHKRRLFLKYLLYVSCCLLFVFYPGHQTALSWYITDPGTFQKTDLPSYAPKEMPTVKNTVLTVPLTAQAYAVYDLDTFSPIITHNETRAMMPASTVKLATALVAYRSYPLDEIVTIHSPIEEETKMGLVEGERISVLNLLYGALMYSANDGAYALAQHYPGGVEKFVSKMNELAKKLHMNDTVFVNPIGFDDSRQTTTARDLALLAREFIYHPFLLNITSTKYITVTDADYTRFHYLSNLNELVGTIPHLGGLKTGTTDLAGQNLISYYTYGSKQLVIVVLKSEDRFTDTKTLIDYVNNNLSYVSTE